MTTLIDRSGRQTPDMTGLVRAKGNGKPKIYRMTDGMWVFELRQGIGSYVKVLPSWNKCVVELYKVLNAYHRNRMLLND